MGRWDRFYEARRHTVSEWLVDAIVDTLSQDLRGWPPPVEVWNDLKARQRFESALAPECPRPSGPVFRAAFQLARWELERNYDALDHYARNDRQSEVSDDARELLCLRFLHMWLTDSMLEILEVSPLKRPELVDCLRRLEDRLLGPARLDTPGEAT